MEKVKNGNIGEGGEKGVVIGGEWGRNRAFVTPTEFGIHSMHHQTLLSSSSSFSSSSSSSALFFNASSSSFALPLCPIPAMAYSHCAQVEKEPRMEALKSSLRPAALSSEKLQLQHQQSLGVLGEEPLWVVERGSLLGDLSVDDLLDFGDFGDNDKETDGGEATEIEIDTKADIGIGVERMETEKSNSDTSSPSSSSVLSFEPAPCSALPDIILPAHDAKELEWVSYIVDDSCSEFPSCTGATASLPPSGPQAQTRSHNQLENRQAVAPFPASGAQGGGASFFGPTVCTLSTEAPVPVKAKRSKRSRLGTVGWSILGQLPFADSSSSSTNTTTTTTTSTSSASSCSATSSPLSSCLIYDHHPATGSGEQSFLLYESHPSLPPLPPPSKKQHKPKKRGRKPKALPSVASAAAAAPSGDRRCSHCGVQKTPQWRAGPLGAKTLCNACGVRFKSGRLLPEYRPACSPTFVSSIHSNSHRKVLEMRRKKEVELLPTAATMPAVASF